VRVAPLPLAEPPALGHAAAYIWALLARLWNKYIHALVGNGLSSFNGDVLLVDESPMDEEAYYAEEDAWIAAQTETPCTPITLPTSSAKPTPPKPPPS